MNGPFAILTQKVPAACAPSRCGAAKKSTFYEIVPGGTAFACLIFLMPLSWPSTLAILLTSFLCSSLDLSVCLTAQLQLFSMASIYTPWGYDDNPYSSLDFFFVQV